MLQKDVIAESEDILKLGLLFGEDTNATTEELPAVLSFQHKLLQEYLAAVYITEHIKLDASSTFLAEAFPTWETIETHREVIQFICGILSSTDAIPIVNHVAKHLVQNIHHKLNYVQWPDLSVLGSCQKEGGLSVAEVLTNPYLLYITNIDSNDTLQLNPSPSDIIVKLDEIDSERFDRLWQTLKSINANVIALHLEKVRSQNVTKLHHFPQLKYLHIAYCDFSEEAMEDLAESINSWGPQPQLTCCLLQGGSIPRSVMTALCKCTHLKHLDLFGCNLEGKLSVLMADPPHALRQLRLLECSLHGADVNQLTQSVRQGHLTSLQVLNIRMNPVGVVSVGHLLEALISIRPHTQLKLGLELTGVNENGKYTGLSDQFETEWKTKLTDTNIKVEWY